MNGNFQVYQSELEKVEQFYGFEDFISSFHIYRGRAKSREEEEDTIVGEFKVGEGFHIFKRSLPLRRKESISAKSI